MTDPNAEVKAVMEKLVQQHIAQLSEHFDSVQIICTKPIEGGGTAAISRGAGNWYARYGAICESKEAFELEMNAAPDQDEDDDD